MYEMAARMQCCTIDSMQAYQCYNMNSRMSLCGGSEPRSFLTNRVINVLLNGMFSNHKLVDRRVERDR